MTVVWGSAQINMITTLVIDPWKLLFSNKINILHVSFLNKILKMLRLLPCKNVFYKQRNSILTVKSISKHSRLHKDSYNFFHSSSDPKKTNIFITSLKLFAIGSVTVGPVFYYQSLDSYGKRQVNVTISSFGRFFRYCYC